MISRDDNQQAIQSEYRFTGFEPLTSNYVYCPNQFFDLCLPQSSRGVVRIIAYLLRETLGWLDEEGNPIRQDIKISYRDLIQKAKVSRGAIKGALNEAIASKFIICSQSGSPKKPGDKGQTAIYSLRWSESNSYHKSLSEFDGFYAGEGYRTPIPNAFFDQIVRGESLSVVKVVGTVIRHTIGYQNQFGGRRSSAALSYRYLQKYANINSSSVLADSIARAKKQRYIKCVYAGTFSSEKELQQASTYAIRWQHEADAEKIGSKTEAERSVQKPKQHRFKKQTKKTVQKPKQRKERFKRHPQTTG